MVTGISCKKFDRPYVSDTIPSTEDFSDQNGRLYSRYVLVLEEGVPSVPSETFSIDNSIKMNANLGQCPMYFKQDMFDFSTTADSLMSRLDDEEERLRILGSLSESEQKVNVEPKNDVENE